MQLSWRKHFLLILILGAVVRLTTAHFVYGAQSVDDYSHALLPTIEHFEGKPFDIPPWRSPLLVWTLIPVAQVGKWLGVETQFGIIQFMLGALGIFSLVGILAFYRWSIHPRNQSLLEKSPREFLIPLYLLGLHFLMTFVSTRAFGEVIAMTLVLVAMLTIDQKKVFWGGLLLGVACLYRFQIGILGLGYFFHFLIQKNWRSAGSIAGAGLIAAALQIGIDLAFGRYPLETLYAYLYVNKDGAVDHSIQPWYNTWMTVVPILFLPFSAPFFRHLKGWTETEKLWWILILVFVTLHSLIPHKEERFLYPILPLLLILLGKLWARSWNENYEKFVFRPLFGALLIFGLGISAVSNSQSAEYEPIKMADDRKGPVVIWDFDSVLGISFFRHRLVKPPVSYQAFDRWPTTKDLEPLKGGAELLLVTSNLEHQKSLELLNYLKDGWTCDPVRSVQSIADHWIYRLNPNKNVRRRPTWVRRCFFKP